MIVKNEEDWIEKAIASVISVTSEVIIVDTGSTDRTLERAAKFDPRVIPLDWTDHFGDARNVSLDAARCAWILVLDADECIAPRDLPALTAAMTGRVDGYHLVQRNYVRTNRVYGWQPGTSDYDEGRGFVGFVDNPLIRFFRNDPRLRFHGAVHEIVDPLRLPPSLEFSSLPVVIHHYGKVRGEERVRSKQHLYLKLGRKKLEDDPENAKAYLDYGIQLQELGRHAESRAPLLKSFEMEGNPSGLFFCALAEKHLKNYDSAERLLEQAGREGLDTLELELERGNVAFAQAHYKKALKRYKKCLERSIGNPVATFNVALSYRKLGEPDKAIGYYQRALELDPAFAEPGIDLAALHTELGETEMARRVLERLVETHPGHREVRLALAKAYLQLELPDRALAEMDGRFEGDAVADALRGAAYIQKQEPERAREFLEAALRRDSSLADANINVSHIYGNRGDFARAARHLGRGFEQTGNEALLDALSLYEARAGMLDEALPHLERVIASGRSRADHWICRVLVLERKQMWAELEAHYRAMIQAFPEMQAWVRGRMQSSLPDSARNLSSVSDTSRKDAGKR